MCNTPSMQSFGANPANIKWTVVRGDNAKLRIDFLENDEKTSYSTEDWIYTATAYDSSGDFLDDLPTTSGAGYVEIDVPSEITANWGTRYKNIVAELPFDLQVFMEDSETTWTPVIGTICVLADVSPGSL